jgi:hypothetical protein
MQEFDLEQEIAWLEEEIADDECVMETSSGGDFHSERIRENRAKLQDLIDLRKSNAPRSADIRGEPFAACACSTVKYKPEDVGCGLQRERWLCVDCGREFIKKPNVELSGKESQKGEKL